MRSLAYLLIALIAAALALAAFVVFHSRHKKSSRRPLRLVGRVASVERALEPEGFVLVDGELWRACLRAGGSLGRGRANARVVGARGCVLVVEPL